MKTARGIAPTRCGRRCTSRARRRISPACGSARRENCREFLDAGDVLERALREPDLRRRRRQHLVAGVGADAEPARRTSSPGSAACRCPAPALRVAGLPTRSAARAQPGVGFIATANHNIQPKGYSPPLMFKNADTRFERITRLRQLLVPGRTYSLEDHQRMQHDALSLRAAADRSAFKGWTASDPEVERARAMLAAGTRVYDRTAPRPRSTKPGATIVAADTGASDRGRRDNAELTKGSAGRDRRAHEIAGRGLEELALGPHARARVPASARAGRSTCRPSNARGGAGTVAADGASYREILDVSNWDRSLATNTPGQSGSARQPVLRQPPAALGRESVLPARVSVEGRRGAARRHR